MEDYWKNQYPFASASYREEGISVIKPEKSGSTLSEDSIVLLNWRYLMFLFIIRIRSGEFRRIFHSRS